MGLGRFASYSAVAAFLVMPGGVRDLVHDPYRIDAGTWVAVALTIIVAKKNRLAIFAVVLLGAVLVKENQLALLVLFYALTARRLVDWRAALRCAAAAVPALVALALLRAAIPDRGTLTLGWSLRHYAGRTVGTFRHHQLWPIAELGNRWLLTSFGIAVVVLALIGAWDRRAEAVRLAPFILIALIHPFLAGNIERDMILAGVPVALLVGFGVARLQRMGPSWLAPALMAVAVAAPFTAYKVESAQQGFGTPTFEALALLLVGTVWLVDRQLRGSDDADGDPDGKMLSDVGQGELKD